MTTQEGGEDMSKESIDIKQYRHVEYKNDASAHDTLKKDISRYIAEIREKGPTGSPLIDECIKK